MLNSLNKAFYVCEMRSHNGKNMNNSYKQKSDYYCLGKQLSILTNKNDGCTIKHQLVHAQDQWGVKQKSESVRVIV